MQPIQPFSCWSRDSMVGSFSCVMVTSVELPMGVKSMVTRVSGVALPAQFQVKERRAGGSISR